jgi:hypothetical protein
MLQSQRRRSAASARTSEAEAKTLGADDDGPGAATAPQSTEHPREVQPTLVIWIRDAYSEQVVFVRHAISEALHPHRIAFAAAPVAVKAQSELAF